MGLALVATCSTAPVGPVAVPPPSVAIIEPALPPSTAPRIELVPAPSITARVLANGEPVADAEVSLSDGSQPGARTARTDRDGIVRFSELEPGAYELWATHEARASSIARVMEAAPDSRVDIVLDQAAAPVRGEVIADGALSGDARVQLVPLDVDQAARIVAISVGGEFEIAAVPFGRWRVEVNAPGHVQLEEALVTVGASHGEVIVRLQRTGVVTGIVVDASGAPVPNATIVLRDQAGVTLQRAITLTPSRLRWIHPLAGTRYLPNPETGVFGAGRSGTRPAECGRGHCGVDLGHVRGSVVHAVSDGQIAALFHENRGEAGRVVVIHHGGGLRSFYMHLDEIRPGLEVGQAIRAGDPVGTLGLTGIIRSAPHLHFAITHESQGRTFYLDPEPMLRAAVVLPEPRPFDPVEGNVAASIRPPEVAPTVASITTDDKGVFRIEGVTPGSYIAAAFAIDLAPGTSAPFTVHSGEDVTGVAITLNPGVLVQGRVLGRDGPIAGAQVIAIAGMGETAHKVASATTDRYGEYTLRSVPGKITLSASAASYGEAERAISIVEGRERQREDFRLVAEDAALRGVVLEPDGGAAAGVSVRIVEGTTRRRTASDSFGKFGMPVASGRYVVELSSPEFPPKRFTLDSDRWVELRLEAGGGARALIRDGHSGAPLAHVRVEATGPGYSTSRITDSRGIVELKGLAAGEWKLTVRAAGYVAASRSVVVRAGRGLQDVTLDLARGATLAGEVRDHFGRRVAGARVSIGEVSTVTDGDGAFRLTGVESGVLEAESEGRSGSLELQLAPGDERLSLTINLSE